MFKVIYRIFHIVLVICFFPLLLPLYTLFALGFSDGDYGRFKDYMSDFFRSMYEAITT